MTFDARGKIGDSGRVGELNHQIPSYVIEKVLEEISFSAPDIKPSKIQIDRKYVDEKLANITKQEDLTRYIL